MKRIVFLSICVLAAAAVGFASHPEEFLQFAGMAENAVQKLWENVETNPLPVYFALGTFLLTVMYHKAKGKSLRESVEVAATRVTVINAPDREESENPVVKRAKARAMRSQLLADRIGLQNRNRKLPDEVTKAEKEACYTEQAIADVKRILSEKQKIHDEAVDKLDALRKEKSRSEAELAEIEAELTKLAERI